MARSFWWPLAALMTAAATALGWRALRHRRIAAARPLVVFFHGKGGRDATYKPILDSLGVDSVLPHGDPIGAGDRHQWWSLPSQAEDQEQYARDVDAAADSVMPLLDDLLARGRPIVLAGHSQGGQLAATLAMRGVAPAVVASGWVPPSLVTDSPSPIVFVHGTQDPFAPWARTRSLVQDLQDAGAPVRLVTVQGAGHTFEGPLLDAWKREMQRATT